MTLENLYISIADWIVHLDLTECNDSVRNRLASHYQAFLAPGPIAKFSIHIHVESGEEFIPLRPGSVWQIETAEQNGHVDFMSHFEKGWVDWGVGKGALTLRDSGDPENFLRVLYAWLCLENDGLLLHASGIISRGKGYVFFAHSGSGKTTVSNLSLDKIVLSDDIVLIKKQGAKYYVHGVPFRGDMLEAPRTNARAELAGLFTLVKYTDHHLEPMSMAESIARLSSCVPFVMAHSGNAHRVLQVCAELATSVPPQLLYFKRDSKFWEIIDGSI